MRFLVGILWMLNFTVVLAQTEAESPEVVVERSSADLMSLIRDSEGYIKTDQERLFREVEALLSPVVDFEAFSRGVMAVHYKKASQEQRERFQSAFKWGLVRTYTLALAEFSEGVLLLVPTSRPQNNPRYRNVKMSIRTKAGDLYPITYVMRLGRDQVWRLANLIVNGVNIGLTYRSQFSNALQKSEYAGDLDLLINDWSEVIGRDKMEIQN